MLDRMAILDVFADREQVERAVELASSPGQPQRGLSARTDTEPFIDVTTSYNPATGGTTHIFMLNEDTLGDPDAVLRVNGEKPSYAKP